MISVHMRFRFSSTAALLTLLGTTVLSPGRAQDPTPSQEPRVRVTTRLVLVSVVAHDRRGQPITGLTKDDFTVFDEGQEQTVSLFTVESLQRESSAPSLPPNTFSNRYEQTQQFASVTAILLDNLNTRWGDRVFAREQVIKFLRQLQPDDRVALYSLGTKLRILHNFTSDARPLLRALDRHRAGQEVHAEASVVEESDSGDTELDEFLNEQSQKIADFYTQDRVRRTLLALESIANHLSSFPGRKNLVWVSSSFPFHIGMDEMVEGSTRDRRSFLPEIEKTTRALTNANMAVYPVDARGLVVGMPGASQRVRVNRSRPGLFPELRDLGVSHDTMNMIADRTGGRAFYNTNDIKGSIRRAIQDSEVTYLLGYYPQHGEWNGKFRKLKVRVKRDGVRLRSRAGYFALVQEATVLEPASLRDVMLAAARSPLPASILGLTVQADPVQAAGTLHLRMTMKIGPENVTFVAEGDRWVGRVNLLIGQVHGEAEPRQIFNLEHEIRMNLKRESYETVTRDGIVWSKLLELRPETDEIVVVARDAGNGSIGSVTFLLEELGIAPPHRTGNGP